MERQTVQSISDSLYDTIYNHYDSSSDDDSYVSDDSMSISSADSQSTDSLASSDGSILEAMFEQTADYIQHIYAGLEDPTINWGKSMLVDDISENDAITEFRFRKDHLQTIADRLWDKGLGLLLDGTKEKVKVENNYETPYETGILAVLFRISFPRLLKWSATLESEVRNCPPSLGHLH